MHFPRQQVGEGGAINGRVRTAFHLTRFRFINGIKYNTYTLIHTYMCIYRDSSEASKVACWVESLNTVGGETKFPRYLWAGRRCGGYDPSSLFYFFLDLWLGNSRCFSLSQSEIINQFEGSYLRLFSLCVSLFLFFSFSLPLVCGPGSDVNVRESSQKQACALRSVGQFSSSSSRQTHRQTSCPHAKKHSRIYLKSHIQK